MLLALASPSYGQTFSVSHADTPLDSALQELIESTRIEILYGAEIVVGKTSDCVALDATVVALLECILQGTGIGFQVLPSGVYLLRAEAESPPELLSLIGLVIGEESASPVSRAVVFERSTQTWTTTDEAGRFVAGGLKPGIHRIMVQHVAYHPLEVTVQVDPAAGPVVILLRPRVIENGPVIVTDFDPIRPAVGWEVEQSGLLEDIRSPLTGAVAGADRLAGVRSGLDGTGAQVEGGGPGESMLLLDGAPVFDPIRNGGFFSSFNPLAVRSLTVLRTGYAAREGSSLTGGIAADHALSSDLDRRHTLLASPLAISGRTTGRMTHRSSFTDWMIAGRRSLGHSLRPSGLTERLREWSRPDTYLAEALFDAPSSEVEVLADRLVGQRVILSTGDFHAAARMDFGEGRQWYSAVYFADNRFGGDAIESPDVLSAVSDEYIWQNRLTLTRYSGIVRDDILLEVGAWNSYYKLKHPFQHAPLAVESPVRDDFNDLATNAVYVKAIQATAPGLTTHLQVGARRTEAEARTSVHPGLPEKLLSAETISPALFTWHALVDMDWSRGAMVLTGGTRLTYVPTNRTLYAEPRFSVRTDLWTSDELSVRFLGATGIYREYVNQFDVSSWSLSAILPTFRVWMPIGKGDRPATSVHAASELILQHAAGGGFRARAFYRRAVRLIVLDRSSGSEITTEGDGWTAGTSMSAHGGFGPWSANVAYSFTRAVRSIPFRFDGRSTTSPWVEPHVLEASLSVSESGWSASVRFESAWGRSWAFRRAYYDYLADQSEFADPEGDRLPGLRQVDVGIARAIPVRSGLVTFRLDLLNATGRRNVIERRRVLGTGDRDTAVLDVNGLPRLAAFSVRIER
ncbi:MAG: TonB-dependent receptor plug domain-containing protein [Rhodothermales bacterium]|nr:TonB-dependent receptor plug domain-containing protein [Rhodothermales bacterium]